MHGTISVTLQLAITVCSLHSWSLQWFTVQIRNYIPDTNFHQASSVSRATAGRRAFVKVVVSEKGVPMLHMYAFVFANSISVDGPPGCGVAAICRHRGERRFACVVPRLRPARLVQAQMNENGTNSASPARLETAADWTKWALVTIMSALVVYRRDVGVVLFALGSILNSVLGKALKRIIRQPRPDGAKKMDHGMPSSHATALSFLSSGAVINLIKAHGLVSWAFAPASLILAGAVVASWWRVSVGYHTSAQVLVGWTVGVFNCLLWCALITPFVHQHVL